MRKLDILKKICKRYGVSLLCLVLSVGVAVGGIVSYSRYVSGGNSSSSPVWVCSQDRES